MTRRKQFRKMSRFFGALYNAVVPYNFNSYKRPKMSVLAECQDIRLPCLFIGETRFNRKLESIRNPLLYPTEL